MSLVRATRLAAWRPVNRILVGNTQMMKMSSLSNNLAVRKNHYHSIMFPFIPLQLYVTQLLVSKRYISIIPRVLGKIVKVPVYVGGSVAAVGSYVAYKIEETSGYTMDKLGQIKDFSDYWKDKLFNSLPEHGNHNSSGGNGGGGNSDNGLMQTAVLAGLTDEEKDELMERERGNQHDQINDLDGNDDDGNLDDEPIDTTQDEMLNLTKQMIEIRKILNKIDSSSSHVTLPSIVVIGSQSSGKSSVLESIVGKDFLPKGSNMVTRRPIELTLVNTPHANDVSADFPQQRIYNLKDFNEVKRVLLELNMAVPTSQAVSEEPIELTIKSPNVPDLSLVDLPGYIQIEAADQPFELKSKIRELCDRYLKEPNIILAISAANVDLANSSALKASKAVDPNGLRTIGVVTKLDLVTPEIARDILKNKRYPLKMGYVGVITKQPNKSRHGLFGDDVESSIGGLFGRKASSGAQDGQLQASNVNNFEKSYFKQHRKDFNNCEVSTKRLREKLIKILEISMSNALEPTSAIIQQELDETSYRFKVEFNDRQLTPKSYLLNNIDILKLSIKEFQEKFDRYLLKSILKAELDQKVLDFLAARYWKDENLSELSSKMKNEDSMLYWHKKLELASSSLTKIGMGRLSTQLVTNSILKELENILDSTQLRNHDLIKELITNTAVNVLNTKYYSTADQVENCIKPFKYEIDLEERDWRLARDHSIKLIKEELRQCNHRFNTIKNSIGSKKLQRVMEYVGEDHSMKETLGMSKLLIERGTEASFLDKRSKVLAFRLKMLKNKCFSTSDKDHCPEIFLNAVSEKLTSTAVLFLNVELLSDFFYNFPIDLDKRLSQLSDEQIEIFAKEDPKVSRHIELQKRKELLELALEKIDSILVFKKSYKGISRIKNQTVL